MVAIGCTDRHTSDSDLGYGTNPWIGRGALGAGEGGSGILAWSGGGAPAYRVVAIL
ncbi:MAG: hypothetical protein ACO4AJ_00790 [Prochlorothrix sp.]